jgi:uncharacterized protein YndB with AHSA1/START domain
MDPAAAGKDADMDVRTELRYAAEPKVVFAMITDEAFLARKSVATGALSHDVSSTPTSDGGVTVRVDRVLPAVVPDFVRKFVGETLRVVQVDTWGPEQPDGSRAGTFDVEISGAPGTMRGTLALQSDGRAGTVQRFDGDVRISVPFVGGKIEKSATEAVLAAVAKEGEVGRSWLAERT